MNSLYFQKIICLKFCDVQFDEVLRVAVALKNIAFASEMKKMVHCHF